MNYIGHNQWNGYHFVDFVNKVVAGKYEKIILFCQNEWAWHHHDPDLLKRLIDYTKNINQPIHIITAAHAHLYPATLENTVVDWWDTYWIGKTYHSLSSHSNDSGIDPYSHLDFKYHFISMNNRPHPHRCRLIDLMAKFDLMKYGAVSVHAQDTIMYQWRYFDYKQMLLEPEFPNDKNQYKMPRQYKESFAQLISESSGDTIMISEKTATPLILGKPFLVAGQMHFHRFLKGLGFQLYDEIFDYSFDDEPDEEKRYEMLLQNFQKLSSTPLTQLMDLQKKIMHKVDYNKKRARAIAYDRSLYPTIANEVIEYYYKTDIAIDQHLIANFLELEVHRDHVF